MAIHKLWTKRIPQTIGYPFFGSSGMYACYLIVQNGDPRKEVIALGQTYFTIQTTNEEFAIFQNAGYIGLYGGLDVDDIHRRKGLEVGQKILDYMGSTGSYRKNRWYNA